MGKRTEIKNGDLQKAAENLTSDTLYFGSIFYNINAFYRNRDEV
jgi:hypothetical protein